jgi:hypothetical protein
VTRTPFVTGVSLGERWRRARGWPVHAK